MVRPALLPYLPGLDLPRLEGIHLNGTALLVTGAVAAVTTLFFGWVPSLTFSALNLASSMRAGRLTQVSRIIDLFWPCRCRDCLLHGAVRMRRLAPAQLLALTARRSWI